MFFPTFQFAIFFLIVFLLYWYVFRQPAQRKILLTIASYTFYAFWNWKFCILLFGISLINYFYGLLIEKEKDFRPRKFVFIIITILNICFLCFFKYVYVLLELFENYFPILKTDFFVRQVKNFSLLLPIGISYYSFKCMSYIFDIYLCKIRASKSFLDMFLYISFFPQILSGPIVQAEYFFTNLPTAISDDTECGIKRIELDKAILLFISGLYKKIIIANFLTVLVTDKIFSNPQFYNTWELLFGILCCTIIIYADFSGYSDMAISVALFFGFTTPKNFDRPYLAKSVSEFWRNWHISFSSWLREYLYFALGGSRFGLPRTTIALFITMLIAGIWHGEKLTFILWGCLQGIALILERIILSKNKGQTDEVQGFIPTLHTAIKNMLFKIIPVFIFINFSWLIFFSKDIHDLILYLGSLKNFTKPFQIISPITVIILFAGLALQLPSVQIRDRAFAVYTHIPLIIKAVFIAIVIAGIFSIATSGIPQFIYFGF